MIGRLPLPHPLGVIPRRIALLLAETFRFPTDEEAREELEREWHGRFVGETWTFEEDE